VLTVPKYNFNWQLAYELETPLKLPAGSKLVVTAHYDNSVNNRSNPAPDKPVYFRAQNQSWDEMFTPFIQYTVDSQDLTAPHQTAHTLDVAEIGGCLETGPAGTWMLSKATDPVVSGVQATSSAALKAAGARALGNGHYRLLGASVFNPESHQGQRVVVKGVLVPNGNESRLNVTSLQTVAATCL